MIAEANIEAAEQSEHDEILARMSHELRTPLNAVIGFTRVLESNRAGNQRPEDIELLKRVRSGGERLLGLVEDVLETWTPPQPPKQEPRPELVLDFELIETDTQVHGDAPESRRGRRIGRYRRHRG